MVFYKNKPIHHRVIGEGHPIVFLHGFMGSLQIWELLIPALSEDFRLILIDLLGHGRTPILGKIHTMEEMAEAIQAVLVAEDISKAIFVGHSMGGYVALALAERSPTLFTALCLLHSTAAEDTPEKKKNRLQSIQAVQANHLLFVSLGVKKLFNPQKLDSLQKEIDWAKTIALSNPIDGITASLRGMYLRKDRQDVLREACFPKLLIIGTHDTILESQALYAQAQGGQDISCAEIATGHMGQLEAPDEILALLKGFVAKRGNISPKLKVPDVNIA